jgi:predicted PurR-regulated permease PerM
MKPDILKLDITWTAILKVSLAVVIFYALFLLENIIVVVLSALILSIIFNPLISFLNKKKIPRAVAAVLVYAVTFFILGFVLYIITPPIVIEVINFSQNFSHYFATYADKIFSLTGVNILDINSILNLSSSMGGDLLNISKNVFGFVSSFIGGMFSVATMFVLAFFLSVEADDINKLIKSFAPKRFEEDALKAWQKSQDQVMGWFGSRILTSSIVGLLTFIICVVLKVKFAVSLGFLAAVLNMVPLVGPILTALIIFSLGLLNSFPIAILSVVLFTIVQLIESNVLTPMVTKQIIGIPNFLVLISILIGGQLMGVVGAVLAIPLFAVLYETVKNYFEYKKNQE